MNVINTRLPGVLIIEPKIFGDARGFFLESYHQERYRDAGIELPFVQDNHSRSQYGVLRGLHFQKTRPQGKLVRVTQGACVRRGGGHQSRIPTCGEHVGVKLTADNHLQLWVPPGYAHGFCVLSDTADFQYKCTDFYYPEDEGGLLWNDPELDIAWPLESPQLSEKDLRNPRLRADVERGMTEQ
ncbi:dTDP-4-dehydrorhamnose 3,5-epimerase [Pseudomonas sp. S2_A02]